MKLKRTKLAALAMTALMAVGAMSLVAYADSTSVPASTTEGTTSTAIKSVDVEFYVTSTDLTNDMVAYTVTYADGTVGTTVTLEHGATLTTTTKPTCIADGVLTATFSISTLGDNCTWTAKTTVAIPATGHTKNDSTDYEVKVKPTCTTPGIYVYTYTCTECGAVYTQEVDVPATGHSYDFTGTYTYYAQAGDNVTLDTSSTAISATLYDGGVSLGTTVTELYKAKLNADGSPVVTNTQKPATYYMVYTCANGCTAKAAVEVNISASTVSYIVIVDQSGLNDDTITQYIKDGTHFAAESKLPSNDSIELANCEKDGSITIAYYDVNGNKLTGEKTITITAHHMTQKVAVFSSQSDMNMCTVKLDSSGNLVVTNNSCYLTVTYEEQVECIAEHCPLTTTCSAKYEKDPNVSTDYISVDYLNKVDNCSDKVYSSTTKTASPSASHSVLGAAKDDIAALVKEKGTKLTYEDLSSLIASGSTTINGTKYAYKDYVKLSDDTSTCTTGGTVTVTYICTIDKVNTAATETITVYAKGHKMNYVVTNSVAATCESDGGYDVIYACTRSGCDYVDTSVATQHYTEARLAHTNETSTDGVHPTNGSTGNSDDTSDLNNQTIYIEFAGTRIVDDNGSLTKVTTIIDAENGTVSETGSKVISGKDGWIRIGTTVDDELAVYVRAYTLCTTCTGSAHKVYLTDTVTGYVTVSVDDIKKQDSDGSGGYVTLTATYKTYSAYSKKTVATVTDTFAYYTSESVYTGKLENNTTGEDPDANVKNGLVQDDDGVWRYYQGGVFASTISGIVNYNGGSFFVANGVLCSNANGLNLYSGTWYYLVAGKVATEWNGLAFYENEWFYLTAGILDTSVTGLVDYDGSTFLFCEGRKMSEVYGLWFYSSEIGGDDEFYYLSAGEVVDYTGAVIYDNTFFLVEDGKLSDYTGTYEYDGATFNVVNGQFFEQVA